MTAAALALLAFGPPAATAQILGPESARLAELLPANTILRNSISNLHAEGDTLWVGPLLNVTTDGGATWYVADTDSLADSRLRLYSLDVEGGVIWAGLGYTSDNADGSFQSAGGFLVSHDGGETFAYRRPQLDVPQDTLVQYGGNTLFALDVIVLEQSPPFDVDYAPQTGTVWVAGWASGIRRSDDDGQTWERVVLPPDELTAIHPDSSYDFELRPRVGNRGSFNHQGFSVLVDETGTVWAGTPKGINRSTDGGLSWVRFSNDGTPNSLVGNWVVSIEEQPVPGRNPIWMATWNAGEAGDQTREGITVTRDGGETFEQVLIGERVIDFAFAEGTVYAAGRENGLFISEDDGATWRSVIDFSDPSNPDYVQNPDLDVMAVATTPGAVWVGTSDGLFKSADGGDTWQPFRADVPLHPDAPSDAVPDVATYAYPNPFSPDADRLVRIRYDVADAGVVDVRIFDFEMRLVRHLKDDDQNAGTREAVWDGTDDGGLRVANGVYFYAVRTDDGTDWGKILVLE